MAVYVFVDFETVSVENPCFNNCWQACFAYVNTATMKSLEQVQYFTRVIDVGPEGFESPEPKTMAFRAKHTPQADAWMADINCPYPVVTREVFLEEALQWFSERGLTPTGANRDWVFAGRYPIFDFKCFPEELKPLIGLDPFKLWDIATMYAWPGTDDYKNRLPSLDVIKGRASLLGAAAHDAYYDVKDEVTAAWIAWFGVAKECNKRRQPITAG